MPLFNQQTAAIAGRNGGNKRWSAANRVAEAVSVLGIAEIVRQVEQAQTPVVSATTPAMLVDEFRDRTIKRVRGEIDTILDAMNRTPKDDHVRLEKLTRSLDLLLNQDQKLSNRPSPGVLKPSNRKSKPAPISPFE